MTANPAQVAAELRAWAEHYAKTDPAKAEQYRKAADLHDTIAVAQRPKPE